MYIWLSISMQFKIQVVKCQSNHSDSNLEKIEAIDFLI